MLEQIHKDWSNFTNEFHGILVKENQCSIVHRLWGFTYKGHSHHFGFGLVGLVSIKQYPRKNLLEGFQPF